MGGALQRRRGYLQSDRFRQDKDEGYEAQATGQESVSARWSISSTSDANEKWKDGSHHATVKTDASNAWVAINEEV
jgi:hypothetical protein